MVHWSHDRCLRFPSCTVRARAAGQAGCMSRSWAVLGIRRGTGKKRSPGDGCRRLIECRIYSDRDNKPSLPALSFFVVIYLLFFVLFWVLLLDVNRETFIFSCFFLTLVAFSGFQVFFKTVCGVFLYTSY